MSSKRKGQDKIGPLKNDQGNLIMDDKKTAELLNNYFASLFTEENTETVPNL